MKNLFHPDSAVMQFLTRVADLIILNFIFLVCCIPIVSIGVSMTAMYRVMLNFQNGDTAKPAFQFISALKANLRPGIFLFLLMLLPLCFVFYYISVLYAGTISLPPSVLILFILAIFLILMVWSVIWPLQAQFENTIWKTIKNAVVLTICYLPRTFLMAFINCFPFGVFLVSPQMLLYCLPLWIFVWFSFAASVNTRLIMKAFRPFLPDKEPADSNALEE